jgi:hypothetical protein
MRIHEIINESREENFKRWFGNSKVVDGSGKPLVVYHGSQGNIKHFRKSGAGIFFAERPGAASAYAIGQNHNNETVPRGANVLPVYLSLQNPLIIDDNWLNNFARRADPDPYKRGHDFRDDFVDSETYARESVFREAKRLGHDGLILTADMLPDEDMSGDWSEQIAYVVFSPTQIKSATGNSGEFNPNNPDITKE